MYVRDLITVTTDKEGNSSSSELVQGSPNKGMTLKIRWYTNVPGGHRKTPHRATTEQRCTQSVRSQEVTQKKEYEKEDNKLEYF